MADVWKDIPRQPRFISAAPYLLLAAVIVFLLEVIERRTGLVSSLRFRAPGSLGRRLLRFWPRTMTQTARHPQAGNRSATTGTLAMSKVAEGDGTVQPPAASAELPAESAADPGHREPEPMKGPADIGMLDALTHAQQRGTEADRAEVAPSVPGTLFPPDACSTSSRDAALHLTANNPPERAGYFLTACRGFGWRENERPLHGFPVRYC